MLQFIIRRLLLLFPVLLGILLVTFVITRLVPGDPCYVMLGEKATKAKCDEFKQRSIHLSIDYLPECMADPVLLKQIYINLLSNAIKYTRPRQEALVTVGYSEENEETIFWV